MPLGLDCIGTPLSPGATKVMLLGSGELGKELAIEWALRHPLSPSARYEMGVGFDANWKLSGYSGKTTRFRLILDVLDYHVEEDEETQMGLRNSLAQIGVGV